MKKLTILMMVMGAWFSVSAQESREAVMEKRAREMHRVLCLEDKDQWKSFIRQNYTQGMIDKPARAVVETNDGNSGTTSSSTSPKNVDNLEAKAEMFNMLHHDFGLSKIISIKTEGEKLFMVLKAPDGLSGTFTLKFSGERPFLIDGLGIEVSDTER